MVRKDMDEDDDTPTGPRRRTNRACDLCRRRKIRCEGQTASRPCNMCVSHNTVCTFNEEAQKRGPPKGYVEALEARVQQMEAMLRSVAPNSSPPPSDDLASKILAAGQSHSQQSVHDLVAFNGTLHASSTDGDADQLAEQLDMLTTYDNRVIGSASPLAITAAIDAYRSQTEGTSWDAFSQAFDKSYPWYERLANAEKAKRAQGRFPLPDAQLVESLVTLYFSSVHPIHPLLHEKTFRSDLASGLAETNNAFRALVFMVLALGSRFSDDPRCLDDFGYFTAIDRIEKPPLAARGYAFAHAHGALGSAEFVPWTLYDIQSAALYCTWMAATVSPMLIWSALGYWLRRAQDVGANRRKVDHWNSSLKTDELRKRAMWSLIAYDRWFAVMLGRSTAIPMEEIDLSQPLDLSDDELDILDAQNQPYPRTIPIRPADAPPTDVAAFNCLIDLFGISQLALRTIYPISRPRARDRVGRDEAVAAQRRNVAELDNLLNRFLETMPDHLRWNPNQPNDRIFVQSAVVLSHYYNVQLNVHRSFIRPDRAATVAFPSLAICMNAARSLSHVLDAMRRRRVLKMSATWAITHAFSASFILLINNYAANKVPALSDSAVGDVHKCLAVLKDCSHLNDQIDKMIFVLEKLHAAGKQGGQKRDHQWLDGDSTSGKTNESSPSSSGHSPDRTASDPLQPPLKRSSGASRKPSVRRAFAPTSLPLATSELGGFSWAGDPTFRSMPSDQPVASTSQSTLPADAQVSTQLGTLTSAIPAGPSAGAVDPLLASQLAFQNLIDPRGEVNWNTAILPPSNELPVSTQQPALPSFAGVAPQAPSPFGHQSFQLDFGAPQDANGYYPLLAQTGRSAQPPDQVIGHFDSTGGLRNGSIETQHLQQQQQAGLPGTPFDPAIFGNAGFDWTAFGATGDWRP